MLESILRSPEQVEGIFLNHGQLVVLLRLALAAVCAVGVWLARRAHTGLVAKWKMSTFQADGAAADLNLSALWLVITVLSLIGLWAFGSAIERLLSPQYFMLRDAAGWPYFLMDRF